MAEDTKKGAAYVPWKTFNNQLNRFHQQGLPNVIDKTLFESLAGGTRNELVTAFRFFELIDDQNKPTAALKALTAKGEAERKTAMRQLLEKRYASLFALDLTKATTKQMNDELAREFEITGSTLRKAARFFTAAAKDLEIPLSQYIRSEKQSASASGVAAPARRRRTGKRKGDNSGTGQDSERERSGGAPQGSEKAVELTGSHASITFRVSKDLLALAPGDRRFVLKIVELLEGYGLDPQGGKEGAND